jgi:tRNA (adenine57-N1/adenine58-N1)-methyltransferase catalytic subunit
MVETTLQGEACEGDLVLLVSPDRKRYLIRLERGEQWYSHRGSILHDDLIGRPLGRTLYTQHGYAYLALEPSVNDLLQEMPRASQIVYGKDAAQIAFRLSLCPGRTVLETGTGSGALTLVLARAVMPTGRVFSYETRPDAFEMARNNLNDAGVLPYVTLYNEDISGGFHETGVDACFLDLREPWLFLDHAWDVLKGSGFFGALVPTTNQVSQLLEGLATRPFGDVTVEEILQRSYKPVAARLRPEDRMIAHSAFLVFARKIALGDESLGWMPEKKRRAYLGKQAMAQREAAQKSLENLRPNSATPHEDDPDA